MKLMLDSVYEDIQRGECQMLIIYILIFFNYIMDKSISNILKI